MLLDLSIGLGVPAVYALLCELSDEKPIRLLMTACRHRCTAIPLQHF